MLKKVILARGRRSSDWRTRVLCTVLSKSFSETDTFANRWMADAQLLRLKLMQNCKLNLEMKWSRRQDGLADWTHVYMNVYMYTHDFIIIDIIPLCRDDDIPADDISQESKDLLPLFRHLQVLAYPL